MATANQSETMEVGESQQTLVASIAALILTEMHETEEREKNGISISWKRSFDETEWRLHFRRVREPGDAMNFGDPR